MTIALRRPTIGFQRSTVEKDASLSHDGQRWVLYRPTATCWVLIVIAIGTAGAWAQDNYEIQVYGSDTVAPQTTMVELHSNFTVIGSEPVPGANKTADGLYPTNHAEHETVEITTGLNDWSELGFYIFTSEKSGYGIQWVGSHIRPRVRAPDRWHWPVGASISFEFGYQRPVFAVDTWTLEIRPIIDKQFGRWYVATNLASFHGQSVNLGVTFAPADTQRCSSHLRPYALYSSRSRQSLLKIRRPMT